jgi:uncharacterized protein YecT (DUF1311 family)
MPKSCLIVLFLFLLFTAAPSFSQHMNERDSPCANVVPTSDSVECLSKAKVSSDAKLNSLYQELRKRLEGDDANRLIATEKLWIQYRDANCEAERALYGLGTGPGPAYLACLEAMTRERTKELRITYTVRLKD